MVQQWGGTPSKNQNEQTKQNFSSQAYAHQKSQRRRNSPVLFHVRFKFSFFIALHVTLVTRKPVYPSVIRHVIFQSPTFGEQFRTVFARVASAFVSTHVFFVMAGLCESFSALAAVIGVVPCVKLLMISVCTCSGETIVTFLTKQPPRGSFLRRVLPVNFSWTCRHLSKKVKRKQCSDQTSEQTANKQRQQEPQKF